MGPSASSFFTNEELEQLGLGSFGNIVSVSRFARLYNPHRIYLGNNVRIDDFSIISANEPIRIGNHVHIAAFSAIFGSAGAVLSDFSGLSTRVTLHTVSDDFSGETLTNPTIPPEYRPKLVRGPILLERHSLVGANSVVMPGLTLHEGAAVGAMSFVTQDCLPWTIYIGRPAKKLRTRSRDLLEWEVRLANTECPPSSESEARS